LVAIFMLRAFFACWAVLSLKPASLTARWFFLF
jgi:hypothetical protein